MNTWSFSFRFRYITVNGTGFCFCCHYLIIYIVKNIIGALVASKEALVIIKSTTVPGGKNIAELEGNKNKVPLPSLNALI
jgi:hypothetical protein